MKLGISVKRECFTDDVKGMNHYEEIWELIYTYEKEKRSLLKQIAIRDKALILLCQRQPIYQLNNEQEWEVINPQYWLEKAKGVEV